MKFLAYDTETTGLDPWGEAEMFAFSITDEEGESEVYRFDGRPVSRIKARRRLEEIWSDTSIGKVMHNAKFDLLFTEKFLGRKLDDHVVHCTHKMSHILQNGRPSHSLEDLAWDLAECPKIDKEVKRLANAAGGFDKVDPAIMTDYQRQDTERTILLFLFFWPMIQEDPKTLEIYETEIGLIRTSMRMEERGLYLNAKKTDAIIDDLAEQVDEAKERLFKLVGYRFNLNKAQEVQRLLFERKKFPVIKKTPKGTGPSVDKETLRKLAEMFPEEEILQLILKIRSYAKGCTTLREHMKRADITSTIHPSINTCAAVTSRQSCSKPNLQNVQKVGVLLNPYPVPERDAFCARPGFINVHIDYAGIELRLLIHYSKDREMVNCINKGDGDVHSLAASCFYGKRFDEAKGDERKTLRNAAKNANFGIPYGSSPKKVAKILDLSLEDASKAFNRYARRFPDLFGLGKTVQRWVYRDGFITTTFGRRLYVPREKAYMGTNYLIQGTAAGVLKRAQNRVHEFNVEEMAGDVRLLMSIHDEIIVEYPRKRLDEFDDYLRRIREVMIDFNIFEIPLEVEAEIVRHSWAIKKEYPIPA